MNPRIELCPTNIFTIKADVMVSSIHKSKNLKSGNITNTIDKKAGPSVQDFLKPQGDELGFGEVVMTPPGNLSTNFHHLMFICLYSWKEGNDVCLQESVRRCLEMASDKECTSIAFPTLGMGGLKYPPERVAAAMLKAILDYFKTCNKTSLEVVYICVQGESEQSALAFLCTCYGFFAYMTSGSNPDEACLDHSYAGDKSACGFVNVKEGALQSAKQDLKTTETTKTADNATKWLNFLNLLKPGISGRNRDATVTLFNYAVGGNFGTIQFRLQPGFNVASGAVSLSASVTLDTPLLKKILPWLKGFLAR